MDELKQAITEIKNNKAPRKIFAFLRPNWKEVIFYNTKANITIATSPIFLFLHPLIPSYPLNPSPSSKISIFLLFFLLLPK